MKEIYLLWMSFVERDYSILNQVLDHNSQLTLNACDLRQKNRMTLVEKKLVCYGASTLMLEGKIKGLSFYFFASKNSNP